MLTSKSENRTGNNTGKTIGWWQTMATPVGAERGGTIPEGSLWGITRAVSAEAESDAVKMGRTLGHGVSGKSSRLVRQERDIRGNSA